MIFKKKQPAQYTIRTLQDICQLESGQLDRFLPELRDWVMSTKGMYEAYRSLGITDDILPKMGMIWKDDNTKAYGGIKYANQKNDNEATGRVSRHNPEPTNEPGVSRDSGDETQSSERRDNDKPDELRGANQDGHDGETQDGSTG